MTKCDKAVHQNGLAIYPCEVKSNIERDVMEAIATWLENQPEGPDYYADRIASMIRAGAWRKGES